ncbi:uncharacterized protein LOC110455433 [Mizuhopecten yessoensis]|uniref:uncharacterized protein LOC110455433 n=1 Tax=Mizuhopecten yessoensis TaxID=6573 RepID=UPI000B459AC3|nr:uncharacterized protein LOC110455433 [Mizuhopecten yessoensis]
MVYKTDMGLKRQLSRRVSVVSGTRPCRVLGRVVGVVTVLAIGFLCGHFIYHSFVTAKHVITDPEQYVKRDGSKRTVHIDDTHILKSTHGAPKVAPSKQKMPHTENGFHSPPKERDGVEIKKDMSVQFRDYVPRKVFVNCGGTFPVTLDLFLNTYPDAHKYDLYTFLPDESYSLFYQTYKRHTLYTPSIVSEENTTVESTNNGFASMVEQRDMIDTVDLPSWILTNLHQDDYVILKLDSKFEKVIVKNIGSKNAIEWIDKFYTTSEDNETIAAYRDELGKFNKQISFWDNSALTYSDFDTVNPPSIPKGLGTVLSQCVDPTESEKFGLFLFSEQFTKHVNQTVNLLITYAGERKVGVSVFLPRDFFRSIPSRSLRELSEIVTLGLFIGKENQTGDGTNTTEEDNEFNTYRNIYVEAASQVHHHTESTLQYVMVSSTTGADVCRRLSQSRQVIVFNETKHITHHSQTVLQSSTLTMDMIGRNPGEILAVDLMKDNAAIITLYMTKRFEPWLVPASKCQPLVNRK